MSQRTVRQFKEGSKWDKNTVNELTPALIRKFRVAYLKGYTPKTMDYNIRARGCDSVSKVGEADLQQALHQECLQGNPRI